MLQGEERVALVGLVRNRIAGESRDIQCLAPNKVLATDDWCGQLCSSNATANTKVGMLQGSWRRRNRPAHQMAKVARRSSALTAGPSGRSEMDPDIPGSTLSWQPGDARCESLNSKLWISERSRGHRRWRVSATRTSANALTRRSRARSS